MTSDNNNCYSNALNTEEADFGAIDSDYEDLPPITDVEDFTDATNISNVSMHGIPYSRIYDPPKSFKDPKNNWLLPHCAVNVKIINADNSTNTHLLNSYLYTIEVEHSSYKWIIKRRHNHFNHLHQQLLLFRASLTIPLPLRKHRERRKSFGPANRRPVPRFPRRPEALISEEGIEKRKQQLEDYLQNCLTIPMYRNHHEMMSFLEISPLSFVDELGHKGKEFLVKKRAGGFRRATCCYRFENFFTDITGHWRKRWLVVKDSCFVYLRPRDGRIRAVMLFDHGFNAESGVSTMGVHHGIRISNMSRDLYLKCWTSRKASELAAYLMETARTYAQDFTNSNRYDSFAPIRSHTSAQWFIDGANHFEAVSEALESAKQEIFITDWWLSPEIYMRRPVIHGDHWRLDRILQRKAIQGVRVYVLLYKEVELGISINSLYTKQVLMKLHPNIKVLRHPDPTRGGPLLWSHHEKLVVIDQSYAFVGGIDLCYGRWDNYEHKLTDLGGIALDSSDGTNIDRSIRNSTSPLGTKIRSKSQSQLVSVEESQSLNESKFYLPVPIDKPVVKFDLSFNQDEDQKENIDNKENNNEDKDPNIMDNLISVEPPITAKKIESNGIITEVQPNNTESTFKLRLTSKLRTKRLQAVARLQRLKRYTTNKLHESDSVVDVGDFDDEDHMDSAINRIRKSASDHDLEGLKGGSKLWFGKDYTNFIVKDFVDLDLPFQDLINRNTTPRMPWHDLSCMVTGSAARDVARHFIERWNFTKSEKAKFHESFPWLLPKSYSFVNQINPPKYLLRSNPVSCQVVRSVANWSIGIKRCETSILDAYIDIINNAKHYIYIENQFFITQSKSQSLSQSEVVINSIGEALYHRIIRAFRDQETFRVFIIFPLLPAFEGEIGTSRGVAIQAITHYNYATICRGNNSLLARLQREIGDTSRYITFYGLRNHTQLHGKLVTELIYVHSKLLLADDKKVIIGSSNINDRSMLGNRDSEVAVVISDEEFESSIMNGQPYSSGKFCGSLRRMLMREHLGLFKSKSEIDIRDPICDEFYKDVWIATAAKNASIYEKVFAVVPTDEVRSFSQLKEYLNKPKLANTDETEAKKLLDKIRGHLVLTPLYFLCDEDLTPSWGTQEKLMPEEIWT